MLCVATGTIHPSPTYMELIYTLLALVAMCTNSAYGQTVNGSFETNSIDSNDANLTSELADIPCGGGYLLMDNVTITAVPEPSTEALHGLDGHSLIFRRRS